MFWYLKKHPTTPAAVQHRYAFLVKRCCCSQDLLPLLLL